MEFFHVSHDPTEYELSWPYSEKLGLIITVTKTHKVTESIMKYFIEILLIEYNLQGPEIIWLVVILSTMKYYDYLVTTTTNMEKELVTISYHVRIVQNASSGFLRTMLRCPEPYISCMMIMSGISICWVVMEFWHFIIKIEKIFIDELYFVVPNSD